jgi:prophage tail gpP-like protein
MALGRNYDIWQTVEVHRDFQDVIDHTMLTVAEISQPSKMWNALKLKPGDRAQVFLAGRKVIDGKVYLRQSIYDKQSHAVQIGIWSNSSPVVAGTVDANPGQYKNYTLQQIASAVFGKVGVGFKIIGNPSPSGADKIFPRVSEMVGETRFEFIERLCQLRNLHMLDDGAGNINAMRGAAGNTSAVLQEGLNILRARLILKNNEYADSMTTVGQNANQTSGDAGRNPSASVTLPPFYSNKTGVNIKLIAPDSGDSEAMQMVTNHNADWMAWQTVDGSITVQGWMLDDGSLWYDQVGKKVSVYSPMLLPEESMTFLIKGVVHKQSNEDGTTTEVLLCRQDGVGPSGNEPLQPNADSPFPSAPPAAPDGSDV